MADTDNKLVTFASLKETVTRLKEYANQFEPRKEVVAKEKLTYSTNYIRAYCDYSATLPATVRVTDDNGSVLLVTGSDNGSWRAVRLIKGDTDRFHKVYYSNGYVYIQVDNDSMYTVFGGVLLKVFGSATGTEIPIENAADTDIEIPTSYPADAISYVNDVIGSATVNDALNTVITDLHTHDNKEVLDLLSESDTGKLQYNGVTIGGAGGASTADAVEYINDAISVTNVEDALNKLIADYYYVAPSVTSFTATPAGGTYEIGSTVKAPITFNWSYNKDITTQTLTDCPLVDNTIRTATYNTDISSNKTFTLSVSDGTKTATKSIAYSFTNKVWYGSAAEGTYDDAFILGLATGKLQTSKSGTYTVTVADREYFFIAMPQSYNNSDTLTGKIGGFETEFGKVATVNHTNASGYATNYNIYKSTNASLGAISFIIQQRRFFNGSKNC